MTLMNVSVEGWRANPVEREAVRNIPAEQLPSLSDEQKEVARKLGVPEEAYARMALAGERTSNRLLQKTEMLARLLEKKLRALGSQASIESVVLKTIDHQFEVVTKVDGSNIPMRINESIVDDLFESGSREADERLSRIVSTTLELQERK
jgi:hypothetical protein